MFRLIGRARAERQRRARVEEQRRQQVIGLIVWLRRRYGGIGAGDVERVARCEGIATSYDEIFELLRTLPAHR
ncbi:hypothetical protein WKI65_44230 [Streptomyces sp. MS1.AVA.3]